MDMLNKFLTVLIIMSITTPITAQKKANRLISEKSPYLQQHAYNPVDWHSWGAEAFTKAKELNKPIFLSIGYSTCHWCHVMEKESFENDETAALMNEHFINIKVDREERPDVDAIYMQAVQMMTGSGGWPLSIWLTPDLKPFFGGTYFPPHEGYGRPSFPSVLTQLSQAWEDDRDQIKQSSDRLTNILDQANHSPTKERTITLKSEAISESLMKSLEESFDKTHGGFGSAPKFPMPVTLEFLLNHYLYTKDDRALSLVDETMTHMIRGGIYDQLGGGFHRYSTDEKWIVPHFEKMLYNNAQLISVLTTLYQLTEKNECLKAAHDSIHYIFRDMMHPDGGFFSAEDADSEGKEGTFYLWQEMEIQKTLGARLATPFIKYYGVTKEGNFFDPHTKEPGNNILVVEDRAEKTTDQDKDLIEISKKRLFGIRELRKRPHRDEKILTGWNGLMITALAKAGAVFSQPAYIEAAEKSARFIRNHLYDETTKTLYRRWAGGEKKVKAQQIDYALFIQGLIDLFHATGNPFWILWAGKLQTQHNELFWDADSGGYFMNVPKDDLLIRIKDDSDNVIPSGNSIATLNNLKLGDLFGNSHWKEVAQKNVQYFSSTLQAHPRNLPTLASAFTLFEKGHTQVIIVGGTKAEETKTFMEAAHAAPIPFKSIILVDPEKSQGKLGKINPFLNDVVSIDGKTTAYVCVGFSCKKPANDISEFQTQLKFLIPNGGKNSNKD